jgi:hypothetical protein
VRVDTTGAISIQLVGGVLDEVDQPTILVGSREGEAPAAYSGGPRQSIREKIAAAPHIPVWHCATSGPSYEAPGREGSDGPPPAEVDPGDGAVERVGTHTAPAATATPAALRPTPIGRRASLRARCWMLDVRCWMGYRWSKKVRTSALKRAGCSMFEA